MHSATSFIKRSLGFVRRHIGKPVSDGFPIDVWTDSAYQAWFDAHVPSDAELSRQRIESGSFSYQPVFSLIVPLYKTPLDYLKVMSDSVLNQTYGNLELVLVNASPESAELSHAVEDLSASDDRVKVVTLDDNYGITENTNHGIDAATGDFCCFLDHDDYIDANLLFEYVKALNEDSSIDVMYCDEDLVVWDEEGKRFTHQNPFIKPQFSPELLLCRNYIVHLMTIRRSIIDSMPRPDSSFDGSQDYNMVLYATHVARRVHGVQKVMYHWRISETSTATNPDSKPYSLRSCRKAQWDQLDRRGIDGSIVRSGLYLLHNVWLEHGAQSISVICDIEDVRRDAQWFVEFFDHSVGSALPQLILTGDSSSLDMALLGKSYRGELVFIDCANANRYTRLNAASKAAAGDFLVFLDAGCVLSTPDALGQLIAMASLDGIGVSSPKTLYRDGSNKTYGVAVTPERIMPMYRGYQDDFPGYQCNIRAFQNVSAVGLQGLTTSRELFNRLGGFDERFTDELGAVDYCIRVREGGYRLVAMPTVKLELDEECPEQRYDCALNAQDYSDVGIAKFDAKWPGLRFKGDPYLNVNLDQSSSYCQIPHTVSEK